MTSGWFATGLVSAAWKHVGGRDRLSKLTGIQTSTLSGYNTGRLRLGVTNAQRIAEATGVSLLDLGAPAEEAPEEALPILARLEELEAQAEAEHDRFRQFAEAVTARLADLEGGQARRAQQ